MHHDHTDDPHREPTPAEYAECRRALEEYSHGPEGASSDLQGYIRELARQAVDLAGRADSPTAHPNYQSEKLGRAWDKLTIALIALGVHSGDLHDGIDRAMKSPVARRIR